MNPLLDPFEREPEEHECHCWLCAPHTFPRIPECQTDAYVGVGHPYGRRVPLWARPKYQFTLWFNGRPIWPTERWIIEVMTGPIGWIVWMYPPGEEAPGSTHARDEEGWPICQCQAFPHLPGSPCMQVSYGNISMEQQLDNPFLDHPTGQNLLPSANAPINRIYRPMTNVLGAHEVGPNLVTLPSENYNGLARIEQPNSPIPWWWQEAQRENWSL